MHNHYRILFGSAIVMLVTIIRSVPAVAQSGAGVMIGVESGAFSLGYSTDYTSVLLSPSTSYEYNNGSAVQVGLGVRLEVPLSETYRTSAIGELLYEDASGNFITTYSNQYSKVSRSATLKYALLNAGFRYSPWSDSLPSGIGIEGAISIGLPLVAKITTVQIANSGSGSIISSMHEEPVQNLNPIRVAMRLSLRYDVPLRPLGLVMSPAVTFDTPFNKVGGADNWRMRGLFFSLGASYHL